MLQNAAFPAKIGVEHLIHLVTNRKVHRGKNPPLGSLSRPQTLLTMIFRETTTRYTSRENPLGESPHISQATSAAATRPHALRESLPTERKKSRTTKMKLLRNQLTQSQLDNAQLANCIYAWAGSSVQLLVGQDHQASSRKSAEHERLTAS